MELNNTQLEILNDGHPRMVVEACPSAGKTTILVEKVRKVIRENEILKRNLVVITYTNTAANEIIRRLGLDYSAKYYIGTIHAYANKILRDSDIDTRDFLDEGDFDKLFKTVIKNKWCVPRIDYLFLDEGQDIDKETYDFIFKILRPLRYFVCLDYNQSIYEWRGSNPQLIKKLQNAQIYQLNQNYRSTKEIIDFSKRIIPNNAIPMRKEFGAVIAEPLNPKNISNTIQRIKDYSNWAVLCRTNAQIEKMEKQFKKDNIPYEIVKNAEDGVNLKEGCVQLLTVHCAKGLEWKNVAVYGCSLANDQETKVSYVGATRAKDFLLFDTRRAK